MPGHRKLAATAVLAAMLGPLAVGPGHRDIVPAAVGTPTAMAKATASYETLHLEGWQVLINGEFLRDQRELADRTLALLRYQLFQITRAVPPGALSKLRTIRIWVRSEEPHHPCMAYHPDPKWLREHGMSPDKARCVELANARTFLQWTIHQPWMVLHEL